MKKKYLILLIFIPLLGSCASIYMNKSSGVAEDVVESLNNSNPELPAEWSTVPFVFDGEIIIADSTVTGMWNGLVESGFKLENPVITSVSPVEPVDYLLFRESWEMEVFFKNKFPRYSYKVSIDGVKGEMILLIFRNENRGYSIIGLKADGK